MVLGWTSIDDPQQPIDDSPMNFTQSTELNYLVCMFLELLGGEFLQFAKDGLFIQHQRLLEVCIHIQINFSNYVTLS